MESFKRAKHVNRRDTIPNYPPIHRDVRLTRCESCCQIFTNKDDLKHHVALTHTGRKPHACAVCGKRYGQLQHLKSHFKLHREARLQVWHTKFTSGTGDLLCEDCWLVQKGQGNYLILGGLWLVHNEDELNLLFYFEEQRCLCLISWLFQSNKYFCLCLLEPNEEEMILKKISFWYLEIEMLLHSASKRSHTDRAYFTNPDQTAKRNVLRGLHTLDGFSVILQGRQLFWRLLLLFCT